MLASRSRLTAKLAVVAATGVAASTLASAVICWQLRDHGAWLVLLAGAVLAGSIAAGTIGLMHRILRPIAAIHDAIERFRAGDGRVRARIPGQDELAALGQAVDSLLDDRVATLARAEVEAERLNTSVIRVLQAMHQLASHDLTAEAPIADDVLGAMADAVNQLAGEIRRVVGELQSTATEVERASREARTQAETVKVAASEERQSLSGMIQDLQAATEFMQRIALLAHNSNKVAERTTQTTETALATVAQNVEGMVAIRGAIADVEERIRRLGSRSHEIDQIVALINRFAERTHMLALNAAMQAAMAGDAGRGFAVVAEEVQQLAESSRGATDRIADLVHNIRTETKETIATMAKTIDRVAAESEAATRSGAEMHATRQTTAQLVDLVRRIAESAAEQATISARLRSRIDGLGANNVRTATQIAAQARIAEGLVAATDRMLAGVRVFKVAAPTAE